MADLVLLLPKTRLEQSKAMFNAAAQALGRFAVEPPKQGATQSDS
jgi:hypothetical protein